jgi:hypothetical protein
MNCYVYLFNCIIKDEKLYYRLISTAPKLLQILYFPDFTYKKFLFTRVVVCWIVELEPVQCGCGSWHWRGVHREWVCPAGREWHLENEVTPRALRVHGSVIRKCLGSHMGIK